MPLLELEDGFSPWRVGAVRHHLAGHPLLQLPKLVALARRLTGEGGGIRYHDDRATPSTSFTRAPETNRSPLAPVEALERIEGAKVWLALHNVQRDPEYRALIDEILDAVQPRVESVDPGMCHRAGWIFVTSPGAITPYHMDHEHNFILQVQGKKTINVWEPLDRDVVTERALELFHFHNSRELVTWSEAIQPRAHIFQAEPGMGAYMPATAPHWVKNGDGVSITISATYYTDSTQRTKLLHRANHELRQLGIEPAPVGASPTRDNLKAGAASLLVGAKNTVRRAIGKQVAPPIVKYSPG